MLLLVLTLSVQAEARTFGFEMSASYLLLGNTSFNETESKGNSIHLDASLEVYPDLVVTGRGLLSRSTSRDEKPLEMFESETQRILLGGLKYRVIKDPGMDVFLGGGYGQYVYTYRDGTGPGLGNWDITGGGLFGLISLLASVAPNIQVSADAAYAWKANLVAKDKGKEEGYLLSARASIGYYFIDAVGVQATVFRNLLKGETYSLENTFVGLGLSARF